jgi:thymidylate kinase
MGTIRPEFLVLLGPDFAGKSTALTALSTGTTPCRILSTDRQFVPPRHGLVSDLRRIAGQALPAVGDAYTPDFLAALLQTAVVHLRDEVQRCPPGVPVVVDSYYYKILAKCRLAGVLDSPMYGWWLSFPQPRRVVYLNVSARTAWRRCDEGAGLNPVEYHGDQPTETGFEQYQNDLAKLMREEIRQLPVTEVDEHDNPVLTAQVIREVLADEFR